MNKITVFHDNGTQNFYTGFIYIWRNSVTGKFYIGSHQGNVYDGYTGSGTHFRKSYKKSPQNFRRKILEYVCGDQKMLENRENFWLQKASRRKHLHYNNAYKTTGLTKASYDTRQVLKFSKLGRSWYNDGTKDFMLFPEDAKGLQKGRLHQNKSLLTNKGSSWITNGTEERKTYDTVLPQGWYLGRADKICAHQQSKKCSGETKERIRQANIGKKKSDAGKQKMRESKLGRKWYTNGTESKLSHTKPGPDWTEGRK